MAVDLAIATDSAIGDIISALQTTLEDELAGVAIAGLPLPAPAAAAYFSLIHQGRIAEEIRQNHSVIAFVYQSAATTFDTRYTKSVATGGALRTIEVGITIAYRVAMFDPFEWYGKTLTTQDVMTLRGHRYNSGVINAMYKNANDGTDILKVDLVSDWAGVSEFAPDAKPVVGMAETIWSITQDVNVPNPQ